MKVQRFGKGHYQCLEFHGSGQKFIEEKDGKGGSLMKGSIVGWTAGVCRQRQRSFRDTKGGILYDALVQREDKQQ